MSARGKALLVLAGVKPRHAGPEEGGEGEEDEDLGPASTDEYAPDEETLAAGERAVSAAHARDPEEFTRAVCALIDAHAAKKG